VSESIKQFNVRMSAAKHRALKVKCVAQGIPLIRVIDDLVTLYLEGKVKLPSKPNDPKSE